MRSLNRDEIDRIATQAADDLRGLGSLWSTRGAAALDAVIRGDPAWTFAVLDARAERSGAVRLVALRRASGAVLLVFGQAASGGRRMIAFGLGEYRDFTLSADPALSSVELGAGTPAWPPNVFAAELAADMAWRFDVGGGSAPAIPADFVTLPADFEPGARDRQFTVLPALLEMLDAAAAPLAGQTTYWGGLGNIVKHMSACGLPEQDRDLWGIYGIECQREDIYNDFEFRRTQARGALTWEQELASWEEFARSNAEKHCQSLLERFRGRAFAKT